MRISTFGYCKETEDDRRPVTLEKMMNFWGVGGREKGPSLCEYITREDHDPEKFMVILCCQRTGDSRGAGMKMALNIVQDCLLRYFGSFQEDIPEQLSEITEKWRRTAGNYTAPSFLAAVGTMEEILLVQYGEGKIFCEGKSGLYEWKIPLRDGTSGYGGTIEGLTAGREKMRYFRTSRVPAKLFLLSLGTDSQIWEAQQLIGYVKAGNPDRGTGLPERTVSRSSHNYGYGTGIVGYRMERPPGYRMPENRQKTAGSYPYPEPAARPLDVYNPSWEDRLFGKQKTEKQKKKQLEELKRCCVQLQRLTEEQDRLRTQRQNILRQLDMLEQDYQKVQEQLEKREKYMDLKAGKAGETDPG